MEIGNHEVAGHQTQIAVSDRIKDSIASIDMFACVCVCVWLIDADVTGRPLLQEAVSSKQSERLKDVLVLNAMVSCAKQKMDISAIISLEKLHSSHFMRAGRSAE